MGAAERDSWGIKRPMASWISGVAAVMSSTVMFLLTLGPIVTGRGRGWSRDPSVLRAFEEEGDLGVGGVGEHVEEAALDGA